MIILSLLTTVVAILTMNLADVHQLQMLSMTLEILALTSAYFILPKSLLFGFVTLYSSLQYLIHSSFALLPISLKPTYVSFTLLAISYFGMDWIKSQKPQLVQRLEN